MRMRMLMVAVFVLAFAATATAATTISLSGDQPQMTLQDKSRGGLTYHVEVGQLQALNVSTKGGEFTQLFIPGFHTSMTEGAPELPQMNRLISVPFGGNAQVEVTNVVTRTVRLADYGLNNPVFPHQPSLSKSMTIDDVEFVHNHLAYGMDKVQTELARVEYQGRMRGVDIARLEVAPVRYLPGSGELEIVESMDISLTFDGDSGQSEYLRAATDSPFFDVVYSMVDGVSTTAAKADLVKNPVKMVIITPPQFSGMLTEYINWKTERGFEVIVGIIGSAEVGASTTTIQTYLHGLYNAGTPADPAPSFVLFIGDVAECPTFSLGGDASDRAYCETTGDLFPEMYYGRWSATNTTQLQAIIDKSLMYDSFAMPDPSYLANVTLIAGMDSGYGASHGNGTIRYGDDYYYNTAHGITANTYYYPDSGSNAANIVADCSAGVGFINYTAHGSQTSWSDPSFTQSNINGLTNNGKYFLAVGNCCLTSTYDYSECFGETFLRAEDKGAIGYIGGSNSTYWDEDVWWSVGSIPSASIGDGMTYAQTGSGVYDATFHDMPNEVSDPGLWYVTNGAVVFRGNLAVSEAGSSREEYYWNIYNLLGDPSISTYMGAPATNNMTYPTTVYVGVPSMTVTGAQGTYIGCTQNGVLVGTGLIDATGSVDVVFNQILTPGVPLKMVAMVSTCEPVITELNVIVPADVTIDPMAIDANVATAVTVTVMEEDGVTPKPGINIWAEGLDYTTTPVVTDASGVAVVTVDYPYGPTLDIVGQDPAEAYRLFTEAITVNALSLTTPDLSVATDIGMVDMFPLNLPGTLNATVAESGYTLYAQLPDGTLHSAVDSELTVTAAGLGQVVGMIVLSGYDVYTEAFDVVEAYGTVAGTVTTGGTAMAGVTVRLVDDMANEVFTVVTDASGNYAGPEDILVDDYTLIIDHFGYLHFEQAVFVNYGANDFDLALVAAPSGVITGYVYDSVTMDPLEGTVRVYRTDTGELYDEVNCDVNGLYTTGSLPYFTYELKVRAWHHVPVTAEITIDSASLEKSWVLDPTNGDLLLIDDSTVAAAAAKYTEKGELLASEYLPTGVKAATEMIADLEAIGYYVTIVDAAVADPATFWDYDLVILACGANTTTLANTALKAGLVQFAQDGGHILLEGGELGFDQYSSTDFATHVMHSDDWNGDSVGNITIGTSDHYVVTYPNDLTSSTIDITYVGYGDSDAMAPLSDATLVSSWSNYPSDASVIAYDTNPAPAGGQIVFFCFNYAAASAARTDLLENAVLWLLTPEVGNCTVQGTVQLSGQVDHSGITVRAVPNGGMTTTAADGSYEFTGLYAGSYNIIATKESWSTESASVTLSDGETLAGVDFLLTPIVVNEFCDAPAAPINDNSTTTCTMTIGPENDWTISGLEVFIDIAHTYQGDLEVTLTTPCQTSVILHNNTGSGTDNIYGWYASELEPDGDMDDFIGLHTVGEWTLTVTDSAGGDTGTVNEWCLSITHGAGVSPVGDDQNGLPVAFKAYQNYPNPFNPSTTIAFDLPRDGQVSLRVYDLAGRMVSELVNEPLAAASHTVVWNGTDRSGRQVASGIYYYRLVTDNGAATHKMTLVK